MADWPSPSGLPDPKNRADLDRWLIQREERLAEKIARSLKKVVTSAYDSFLDSLTASGDLGRLDAIIGDWTLIAEEVILPEIEETYLSGAISAYTSSPLSGQIPRATVESWSRVVNTQAVAYMANATSRMADVGRTVWNDVRDRTTNAIASGMSNEELKGEIERLSGFSEYRADTIARTETNAAYINGDWEAAQALGEFGPAEKVWVATMDARTRETHAEIHDTALPMEEPFDVGGESMMYPHDPNASAAEVVNCRCYVEFLYPGDTRPDGSIVAEPGTEEEALAEAGEGGEVEPEEEIETGPLRDDFESGRWVEIDLGNPESVARAAERWVRSKPDGLSRDIQRDGFEKWAAKAKRLTVNGDLFVMDSHGLSDEAFQFIVRNVDEMRSLNRQAGDRVIVNVRVLKPNVRGTCEMARRADDFQMLELNASMMESTDPVPMTGFKQASVEVDARRYTITHEWGHATDEGDFANAPRNMIFGKISKQFPDGPPNGLSGYGRTNKWEAYAECFADWVTSGGKSTNPATQAYAQKYGWRATP